MSFGFYFLDMQRSADIKMTNALENSESKDDM